ncbi:MAG: peptidoglycan-binding protein, partial [Lachnospiraceae bacterium]|nr:peptidoglycan-binding protein [Lachnospiraceae bacterium]
PAAAPAADLTAIAKEVIQGKWGNGQDRVNKLTAAGYDAAAVQTKVNELLKGSPAADLAAIAKEVIQGKWGNGQDRINKLKAAGYDPNAVQKKVNELLK